MGRQQSLEGMENAHGDKDLDTYAEAFKRASKKRKAAQDAEIDARSVLIDAMKKKKLVTYEDRRVDPPLLVTLVAQEKVKVTAIDETAEEDDDEGDGEVAEAGSQRAAKKSAPAEA